MALDPKASEMLSKGWYGERLSPSDCEYLLTFGDHSSEANLAASLANRLLHKACTETGQICADIDTITGPCPGNCHFCEYAEGTSDAMFQEIDDSDLARICEGLGGFSDVRSIRLTSCGYADIDTVCRQVGIARDHAKRGTRIYVNTKDLGPDECRMLRDAGAYGAYHAPRIREGRDTEISVDTRLATISNLRSAGLQVITGVEPIGPEHENGEIVETFFSTLDMKCAKCEVNAREPVPGTELNRYGKLKPSRLTQIRSVLTLASSWYVPPVRTACPGTYVSGSNIATVKVDRSNYAKQVEAARRKLFNSGYDRLLKIDDSAVELNLMYLKQTGSV